MNDETSEYPRTFTFFDDLSGYENEETFTFESEAELRKYLDDLLGKNSPLHQQLLPDKKPKRKRN